MTHRAIPSRGRRYGSTAMFDGPDDCVEMQRARSMSRPILLGGRRSASLDRDPRRVQSGAGISAVSGVRSRRAALCRPPRSIPSSVPLASRAKVPQTAGIHAVTRRGAGPMEGSSQTPFFNDVTVGEALSVKRFFTTPGQHAFDTVQWETRDARIAPRRQGRLRAARRRVPVDVVAELDEHRRPEVLPRPARLADARALRQADDRPRRGHDRRLGPLARVLRVRRGRRRLRVRARVHPRPPDGGVQLAGLVQRGIRREPSGVGLFYPKC